MLYNAHDPSNWALHCWLSSKDNQEGFVYLTAVSLHNRCSNDQILPTGSNLCPKQGSVGQSTTRSLYLPLPHGFVLKKKNSHHSFTILYHMWTNRTQHDPISVKVLKDVSSIQLSVCLGYQTESLSRPIPGRKPKSRLKLFMKSFAAIQAAVELSLKLQRLWQIT